jgi:hypothetical protein
MSQSGPRYADLEPVVRYPKLTLMDQVREVLGQVLK